MQRRIRWIAPALVLVAAATIAATTSAGLREHGDEGQPGTTTPIKHLVVIFQENVSFDHYFATYPDATNPAGEPAFTAKDGTPSVNGLNDSLLAPNNPNSVQPFRLDRSQFETADQDHNYVDEQKAYDGGLMDQFVEKVGRGNGPNGEPGGQVMGYFDGNTVTALWNYAQSFAMSDNSFSTTFGPSPPGALTLTAGQTHGFTADGTAVPAASQSVIGDPQPTGDKCDTRDNSTSVDPNNKNIGDLLNAKQVTWGWFQGGFSNCAATHANMAGGVANGNYPPQQPLPYLRPTPDTTHAPPAPRAALCQTKP